MRWKPDFETAATEFGKAGTARRSSLLHFSHFSLEAVAFKNAKAYEQAREAYVRASEAQYTCQSLFTAAQSLENGAQMAKELKRLDEAAGLYERASRIYMEHGQADNGAQALNKGAQYENEGGSCPLDDPPVLLRMLAATNAPRACELYVAAIELYEAEGREQFGLDTFKAALTLMLKSKRSVFGRRFEYMD